MDGPNPVITSSDDRTRSWLVLAGGLVVTAALVFAVIALWPSGGGDEVDASDGAGRGWSVTTDADRPTGTESEGQGEPSERTSTTEGEVPTSAAPAPSDLFTGGFGRAYADLLSAAGTPAQLLGVNIYDTYAFMAYRDPANPGNIDQRQWRDGEVSDAEPNTIDDRVDADTEPALFTPGEIDPGLITQLVADAPSRYDMPMDISHIIIDRFLPFDERVLIRVYASPTDGRSGGGYVSYDTAGTFVDTCC